MLRHIFTIAAILAVAGLAVSDDGTSGAVSPFEPPVKLMAGGAVIDVSVGHADPFVFDVNGDGKLDVITASSLADTVEWHENLDAIFSGRTPKFTRL